ncbi:MAG: O-antigen ligase family protein [Candidatus Korobacteraceae bacterium]
MTARSRLMVSKTSHDTGMNQIESPEANDKLDLSPVPPNDFTSGISAESGTENRENSTTNSYGEATSEPSGNDSEETPSDERGKAALTLTYIGVFLFCAAYFFRPQDYIAALASIPLGKITAGIAGLSLLLALFSGAIRLRTELKWLLALFGWLILCIPFSSWRGGSFHVVILGFGRILFVAIAASAAVNSWGRLRRLMALQTLAMLAMAVLAFGAERRSGRMYGTGNMFSDPNDFALQLCIVLPFCVALLRTSTSWIGKFWWFASIFMVLAAIVSTYSRGGFIALIATLFFIWRRFKPSLSVVLPFLVLTLVIATAFIGSRANSYIARIATIANPSTDPTGSAQGRKEILIESLRQTALHPVFGVGPGEFAEVAGHWHETHNTYTQLSAEAGLPALLLFLVFLRSGFRRLREVRKGGAPEEGALAAALRCSLAAYAVGAFFLPATYWLTPYLLVAYAAGAFGAGEQSNGMMES